MITDRWFLRLGVCSVVLLAGLLGFFQLSDFDLGLARVTGEWIAENGEVPTTNVFSEIHRDRSFVDDKWLFHLLAWHTVDGLGADTAVFLRVLLLAFLGVLLIPRGNQMARAFGVPIAVVALITAAERFSFRPELLSLLFLAVFVRLLIFERSTRTWHWLVLLALQVLWVNLHGYFVLGPLVAATAGLGGILDRRLRKESTLPAFRRVGFAAILFAACFLNPYGWELVWSPFEILRDLETNFDIYSATITEFVPSFGHYPLLSSDLIAYRVLLGLGVVSLLLARTRIRFAELLPVLLFFVMSLNLRRNMAPFAILAAPILALWLERGVTALTTREAVHLLWSRLMLSLGVFLAASMAILQVTDQLAVHDRLHRRSGTGFSQTAHPDAEIDFLVRHAPPGVIFNSFSFGSHLAGRAYPDHTPFIDGNTAGYDVAFLKEYVDIVTGKVDPASLESRYGINWFLLKPGHVLTQKLLGNESFVPVFLGRHAVVIASRDALGREAPGLDLRLALEQGRFDEFTSTPMSIWSAAQFPVAELSRAYFLASLGRTGGAITAAQKAVVVNGRLYETWYALGVALMASGRNGKGQQALDRAAELAPNADIPFADREN